MTCENCGRDVTVYVCKGCGDELCRACLGLYGICLACKEDEQDEEELDLLEEDDND